MTAPDKILSRTEGVLAANQQLFLITSSLHTLKPLTDEENDADRGYSSMFLWKSLRAGVHVDVPRLIKPTQTFFQTK